VSEIHQGARAGGAAAPPADAAYAFAFACFSVIFPFSGTAASMSARL
jgi:hypothetical protein